ncbi:glycosyltransferase family 2 protein [Halodesulfovibrio sp.]|jgi:glycosyltransferase involved in cell wall biosynthesis|uniref:glycosyltransferase family 2 protein n=1 Tax=Halodesulfovibrio sp. TaxID=1912772 RepID=UPI0025FEBCB5|nr:glycosyltransferase family 2 protein [Halodesulfovibrio sp.]MCT4626296.1 glycosyltransferase family 2 protein [Halodesulfovibrio sp.]
MATTTTGLILTYNGEATLKQCIESLHFCDSVVVIDSFSTDKTVAIAENLGATVIQNAWNGPAAQFTFAFSQINADWVVSLDQDEVCTSSLKAKIVEAIANAPQDTAGYYTKRKSWYYNRFMKHSGWYPDWLLRVFRPEKLEVKVSGAHYSFHPKGKTEKLDAEILHYPYMSFSQHLQKIDSYAQQGADDLHAKGKKGGLGKGITHGTMRFIKLYFIKLGFLDGKAGFINAIHGAFYAFLKYVRVSEGNWGAPFDADN